MAENYLINNAKFKYSIIRLAPVYSSNYFINIEKRLVPVNLFNKKVYFKIGKGKQLNSFVDLRNVIHAIDFLVNKNNCFENSIYNISDNYNYSINDLLNYFKNKRTIIIKIPRILFNAIYYAAIILFFFKKNRIKSAYYKLTKNNIYDISKINNCGIYFINSLIKNNST